MDAATSNRHAAQIKVTHRKLCKVKYDGKFTVQMDTGRTLFTTVGNLRLFWSKVNVDFGILYVDSSQNDKQKQHEVITVFQALT